MWLVKGVITFHPLELIAGVLWIALPKLWMLWAIIIVGNNYYARNK